jgi:hypothetical protein
LLLETIVAVRVLLVDISIAPIAMDGHTLTASPVDAQEPREASLQTCSIRHAILRKCRAWLQFGKVRRLTNQRSETPRQPRYLQERRLQEKPAASKYQR